VKNGEDVRRELIKKLLYGIQEQHKLVPRSGTQGFRDQQVTLARREQEEDRLLEYFGFFWVEEGKHKHLVSIPHSALGLDERREREMRWDRIIRNIETIDAPTSYGDRCLRLYQWVVGDIIRQKKKKVEKMARAMKVWRNVVLTLKKKANAKVKATTRRVVVPWGKLIPRQDLTSCKDEKEEEPKLKYIYSMYWSKLKEKQATLSKGRQIEQDKPPYDYVRSRAELLSSQRTRLKRVEKLINMGMMVKNCVKTNKEKKTVYLGHHLHEWLDNMYDHQDSIYSLETIHRIISLEEDDQRKKCAFEGWIDNIVEEG